MSQMKEFGLQIARLLFEQHMPVSAVVDVLAVPVEMDGKVYEPDRAWLKEQIEAVKRHKYMWGYGNIHQVTQNQLKREKLRAGYSDLIKDAKK